MGIFRRNTDRARRKRETALENVGDAHADLMSAGLFRAVGWFFRGIANLLN